MKKAIIPIIAATVMLAGCGKPNPQAVADAQLRVAAGEPKLVGTYTLFRLPNALTGLQPKSADFSRKLELTEERWAELKRKPCTLEIRADHTLIVSNYPARDARKSISVQGKWSLSAYEVFDAKRYRISVSGGQEVKFLRATCGADMLPDPRSPFLHVDFQDESGDRLGLSFKKVFSDSATNGTAKTPQ